MASGLFSGINLVSNSLIILVLVLNSKWGDFSRYGGDQLMIIENTIMIVNFVNGDANMFYSENDFPYTCKNFI